MLCSDPPGGRARNVCSRVPRCVLARRARAQSFPRKLMGERDERSEQTARLHEAAARLAENILSATSSFEATLQLLEGTAIREWSCDLVRRADQAADTARRAALERGGHATRPTRTDLFTCACGRHKENPGYRRCCSRCDGTAMYHTRRCHRVQVHMTLYERSHAGDEESSVSSRSMRR